MYKIGDIYDNNGITGVVISTDSSGLQGFIMSLDEIKIDWYGAEKWCKDYGIGWFLPSVDNLKSLRDSTNLRTIQMSLIYFGIPLGLGEPDSIFDRLLPHNYWTTDLKSSKDDGDWMNILCMYSDYSCSVYDIRKDFTNLMYARALHAF